MNVSDLDPIVLGVGAAAITVVVVAIAAFVIWRAGRTRRYEARYGPEYARTVGRMGSRRRAERMLEARDGRRAGFDIQPVPPADREVFRARWEQVQAGFVDAPADTLRQAADLVDEVAATKGYPPTDRDERLWDISYDHAAEVHRYRSSAEVEGRARSPEQQREAVLAARALFEAMLGRDDPAAVPPAPVARTADDDGVATGPSPTTDPASGEPVPTPEPTPGPPTPTPEPTPGPPTPTPEPWPEPPTPTPDPTPPTPGPMPSPEPAPFHDIRTSSHAASGRRLLGPDGRPVD